MLDVVIRERYVLDTIRAPGDFAHEKAHEAAGSATLRELPNGDVAFGNPKGLETLAHASQFEEIRKELGDLKQELVKVNEKLRDHDELLEQELARELARVNEKLRDHDELLEQELARVNEKLRDHDELLGDSRKWMAVRKRNFLTFLRDHSKKGSFLSKLVNRFSRKQQKQIHKYNKLIHEADMVTDMRMVKMCLENSSKYQDGLDMLEMFAMIYQCSLSVAECLEANRVTYAIKTIDQIANHELSPEFEKRKMSPSQSKAVKELKLYLEKIDLGKGITLEEAQELQNLCDAFQAAKE
ncbi:hypothetical protein N8T08_004127 [Aspergillus melleus]|uniref:Uncharacterized protein n=1 Tax=Aspergillus melleus TaxID=138277 RepID=A0ACC3B534_9EURO|nr:hypothetical protein N8T08_004127 [Aspergillus melleus]